MKFLKKVASESEAVAQEYDVIYSIDGGGVVVKAAQKEDPNYVDLGLPSGTLWAKCNIGATVETEYGLLFQWGATEGHDYDTDAKNYSTWSTAPFNNGSSSYNSAYFASVSGTVCPNGVLASPYDAARANMGGSWRMPTQDDFNELTANTTVKWTSMTASDGSSVYGMKFTASNGNYIFIPASGLASNGSVDGRGSYGYVWSSSLCSDYLGNAWCLYSLSGRMGMNDNLRYIGFPVRGVVSK